MNIRFRCDGFTADTETAGTLSDTVKQIEDFAPNAKTSVRINYDGSHYVAVIDVVLKRGLFSATSSDFNVGQALRTAGQTVVERIVQTVDLLPRPVPIFMHRKNNPQSLTSSSV